MSTTHLPPTWRERLLDVVNAPIVPENLRLLLAWQRAEGGDAKWNPLNSTLWVQNYTLLPNYNDVPVRNYSKATAGVCATALTLIDSVTPGRYNGILGDLQGGTKKAEQIVHDRASEFHIWGTDTTVMLDVLAGI
jgi:hypothetical protein